MTVSKLCLFQAATLISLSSQEEFRDMTVYKTRIHALRLAWFVHLCVTAISWIWTELTKKPNKTALEPVEGAITQSSPFESDSHGYVYPVTAWYKWKPARFQQLQRYNTDQSYPGIRTARMCRQPGCRYLSARLFPVSPSYYNICCEKYLQILTPAGQTFAAPNLSKPG